MWGFKKKSQPVATKPDIEEVPTTTAGSSKKMAMVKGAAVVGGAGLGIAAGTGAANAAEEAGASLVSSITGALPSGKSALLGILVFFACVFIVYVIWKKAKG